MVTSKSAARKNPAPLEGASTKRLNTAPKAKTQT